MNSVYIRKTPRQREAVGRGKGREAEKQETAWRPYAWSTVSEAEVAGPGCHSGRFIYSKSAGEPLKRILHRAVS